mmetsp:Transcript_4436/g.11485  ORF Transcript_4436/g.11485 Transcript_4436/m.11485 type:complete len:247 (-) Transcript_4436:1095-1835(-)
MNQRSQAKLVGYVLVARRMHVVVLVVAWLLDSLRCLLVLLVTILRRQVLERLVLVDVLVVVPEQAHGVLVLASSTLLALDDDLLVLRLERRWLLLLPVAVRLVLRPRVLEAVHAWVVALEDVERVRARVLDSVSRIGVRAESLNLPVKVNRIGQVLGVLEDVRRIRLGVGDVVEVSRVEVRLGVCRGPQGSARQVERILVVERALVVRGLEFVRHWRLDVARLPLVVVLRSSVLVGDDVRALPRVH